MRTFDTDRTNQLFRYEAVDGDGETDYAVWRPSPPSGVFYVLRSSTDSLQIHHWGTTGDFVVPGDYDRDGKNDPAVYRPSNNTFYALRSSNLSSALVAQWGISGDVFVPGDYDGNGQSDIAVWRPSNGTFYVLRLPGFSAQIVQWGTTGDMPVANSNVR